MGVETKGSKLTVSAQVADCLLEVQHLTTRLRTRAGLLCVVDDLSFELRKGRTIALVGESGCGKSMTALSLLNLLPYPPACRPEGSVIFQGRDLLKLPDRELRKVRGRQASMIFQDPMSSLNPVYSVGAQLTEVINLHLDLWEEEAENLAVATLEEVGIAGPRQTLRRYPHELSGGMKQRVMIAMAMVCKPALLIADEPTTALDVTVQAQVLELIRLLQRQQGTALLLITHDMGVVAEMADEVIVMYAGQAVERGSVEEIFDSPLHPYTQGLFASRPALGKRLQPIPGTVPRLGEFPTACRFEPRCSKVLPVCGQRAPPLFNHKPCRQVRCWLHEEQQPCE
jgi:oligopeptide/dipeptide ABC transporter ATP-binding protein